MEEEEVGVPIAHQHPNKKRRRNKKRSKKKEASPPLNLSFSDGIPSFDAGLFPLLLASASRDGINPTAPPLLRCLLRRIRRWLLRSSQPVPPSLVSLFPLLFSSSSDFVVALSVELVGVASLKSVDQNKAITSDTAVVKALIRLLTSGTRQTARAVLTALMDLSVTPFARDRIREAGTVHKLLYMLCQEMSQDSELDMSQINKLLVLILDMAVLLINTSNIDFSDKIPQELVQKVLPLLSKIQKRCSSYRKISYLQSQVHEVSETIFRISVSIPRPNFSSEELRSYIFGRKESDFKDFLLNFWEKSPVLIKKGSKNFQKPDSIFGSLVNYVNPKTTDSIIDSILQYSVSCPAIVSDELDINQFLNDMKGFLGSPLIYNQDIRIVKTEGQSNKKEEHFPFVDKCKEAFNNGYSIALKGMEFRSDQIAHFSLALSKLFGLPSIGVNLYLSPHAAQGLARHYDDHCVLVWQITGCKSWSILKDPKPVMPRLYESLDNTFASEKAKITEIVLEEGDILYIPRGYFHEARTVTDTSRPHMTDCSLHLTFAIEVERPFEWEGFVHVALHCWRKKLNQQSDNIFPNLTHTLLLHIAIKLISNQTPAFWKACLVASNFKIDNQKSMFDQLINIINEESNFVEAFNWIKLVVEKREEDSIHCMRWLQNLYDDICFDNLMETLESYVVVACNGKSEEAMAEFSLFKSSFCKGAVYEDACSSFGYLLEKYRKARRPYMNGMLSLHRKY